MIVRRFWFGIQRNSNILRNFSIRSCSTKENSVDNVDTVNEIQIPREPTRRRAGQKAAKQEKLIRVAIVGIPNAGKSTLINALAEHRVCPVSRKVHTTRNFSRAITVRDNTQIVFFDTPGLVGDREIKKFGLEKSFSSAYRHSIQNADLVAVVHDVSNRFTRKSLDETVVATLAEYPKVPSVLILNKIDELNSKRILLDLVRTLTKGCLNGVPTGNKLEPKRRRNRSVHEILDDIKKKEQQVEEKIDPDVERPNDKTVGYDKFQQVFMVSALNGDGVAKVMDFLCSQAKQTPWLFDADTYSDRTPEDLIVQSVQAKLLDFLPQEIPYKLTCQMEFYSVDKGQIYASVLVTCPNKRIEKLVCGEDNGKLRQITERVTSDLIETFAAPISFTVSTMCKIKEEK